MNAQQTHIHFRPNQDKIVEAIVWIAQQRPGIGFHAILKLLFFADKYHLNRYERPVIGDQYIAMQYGPVASATYDILKGDALAMESISASVLPFVVEYRGKPSVHALREPDLDFFSESDIEALEWSNTSFGSLGFAQLTDLSHNDRSYQSAVDRDLNSPMLYEEMLDDSEYYHNTIQYLRENAPFMVL
ncbi:MAG: SocA family protein [Magnetococcales bacterium]|nr:SocA family protein [Magnetococcales bacterium]